MRTFHVTYLKRRRQVGAFVFTLFLLLLILWVAGLCVGAWLGVSWFLHLVGYTVAQARLMASVGAFILLIVNVHIN